MGHGLNGSWVISCGPFPVLIRGQFTQWIRHCR